MSSDKAPSKELEKETINPTEPPEKGVSMAHLDDASFKSYNEKSTSDLASASKGIEKDFGSLAFDFGDRTKAPGEATGDRQIQPELDNRDQPGGNAPDSKEETAPGDSAPDNSPVKESEEVGATLGEAAYDWSMEMYSRYALGEDRARQTYDLKGTLVAPDTEEGFLDSIYTADDDLQATGDKFGHVLDPEIAKELLKDLGDDTQNVSGKWADEDAGIAYLKIDNFLGTDTAEDLAKLLDTDFKGSKGIILDLRSNPGGRPEEGLQTAALFLDKGTLMSNLERVPNESAEDFQYKERMNTFNLTSNSIERPALPQEEGQDNGKLIDRRGEFTDRTDGTPLTILVDEHTASTAEILLAALRQNKEANAKSIGETPAGKGIGQTVLIDPTGGEAITITSSKFFRPDGTWAGDYFDHKYGMATDVNIPSDVTDLGANDIQYNFAIQDMRNRIDS